MASFEFCSIQHCICFSATQWITTSQYKKKKTINAFETKKKNNDNIKISNNTRENKKQESNEKWLCSLVCLIVGEDGTAIFHYCPECLRNIPPKLTTMLFQLMRVFFHVEMSIRTQHILSRHGLTLDGLFYAWPGIVYHQLESVVSKLMWAR